MILLPLCCVFAVHSVRMLIDVYIANILAKYI